MKPEIIKAIFTNLLFVIGVVLMVMGFIRGSSTVINSIVFDQYPLDEWQETRCSVDINYIEKPLEGMDSNSESPEALEERKVTCQQALNNTRKTRQVNDITYSFGFFISGIALALSFKRFIFNKEQ